MSIFERFDRHAVLMDRMADTVGVDLAELMMRGRMPPSEYRDAVFRCVGCTRPGACADWVAAHPDGAGRPPGYCRNRDYFDRLAIA